MIRNFVFAAALFVSPLSAQTPPVQGPELTLEHRAAVHCSAVFAILAADQARGDRAAKTQLVEPRGREYFVRTSAQVMDATGASRAQVQTLLQAAALAVRGELARGDSGAGYAQLIPPCRILLDLAIPADAGRTR